MSGLHRSRRHRIIAGVCGGLAESFGLPVWLVRFLFLLTLLPGGVPGLLLYVLLWIALPTRRVGSLGGPWARPVHR
ncbi:MAG TPA: PspC domain-containing protein [Chloroflexota bacterium]|nr:PspC domain-containing protein [Chloroflexota bacterium]HZT83391.1 PspC domain-containing protein [Gemmataceae bacterium]